MPTPRSATVANSFNGSTSRSINKPTGTVEGDLLVATFAGMDGGFFGSADDLTPPSGWTTVSELLVSTTDIIGMYYKIAGASEPTSYTWTSNDGTNSTMAMTCIENGTFDPADPLGAIVNGTDYSRQFQASTSTSVSAPSVTPDVDGCLGVAVFSAVQNGFTWTAPSGFTELIDSTDGYNSSSVHTATLTTSATGAVTATASASVATNNGAGMLFVVRPAVSAGTDVDGTPTSVSITTGSADVVPTTEVGGTATSVATATGTADVVPTTQIAASSTTVTISTGPANVVPTTEVAGTPTTVAVSTDTAAVTATADIAGTPTAVVTTTDTADVTGAVTIDGASSSVSITTAIADVVPTTEVDGTSTTVSVTTGTADITSAVLVDGTPTAVGISTGTADIVATTVVDGAPALVVITAAGADIVPTADIDGVPTSVSITIGTADLGTAFAAGPLLVGSYRERSHATFAEQSHAIYRERSHATYRQGT